MEGSLSHQSSTISSTRSRFIDETNAIYRFKPLRTFQRRKLPIRPSTSPEKPSPRQYGVNHDAVDRIASVQSPRLDLIHRSLGDGIMMLREEKMVSPSKFINLEKVSKNEIRKMRKINNNGLSANKAQQQAHKLPLRAKIVQERKSAISRYASIGVQTDEPVTPLKRPSTVSELVTSYEEENHKKEMGDRYRISANGSSSLSGHRCTRCSHLPDIQIEGRSLNYFLSTANGLMASTHCEILGPSTCPDCTRTKSQINYEALCNSTVEPNENDVYKLQVIQSKVPFMGQKEVKRKVYDGKILDAINTNVLHLDIDSPRLDSFDETESNADASSKSHSLTHSKSFYKSTAFPTIPEVSTAMENPAVSIDSGKTVSESSEQDIITAKVKIQRHESSDYYERMNVEFSENSIEIGDRVEQFQNDSFSAVNEDNENGSELQNNPSSPTAQISSLASEHDSDQNRRSSLHGSNRIKHLVSFTEPKLSVLKKGRAINKYVTPSPTFFYDIADLYHRLHKRTGTYKRSDSVNLTLAAAHMNIDKMMQKNEETEKSDDESGSDSSISPRTLKSLLSFEPPVMYERKSRQLGVPSPEVGGLANVQQESLSVV